VALYGGTYQDPLTGQATDKPRLSLLYLWSTGQWQVQGYPDQLYERMADAWAAAERLHPGAQAGTEDQVAITAVQDRLTIDLESDVKPRLGLTTGDADTYLESLIVASKAAADGYCCNLFLDADGEEDDIPEMVKVGCLKWIEATFLGSPFGVTSERARDLSRTYKDDPLSGALRYWQQYRMTNY